MPDTNTDTNTDPIADLNTDLSSEISACRICADRFGATVTAHNPRPVVWFAKSARILIAGQAPGIKVHRSGRPFTDPSGDRLRDWMGVGDTVFYDRSRVAIVPMAFCFPGYDAQGSDLPPPRICSQTWHKRVMQGLPDIRLTLLVGGYAHKHHLGAKTSVTQTVANWRAHAPRVYPLPHPSWRNSAWLTKNPWFGTDLLPDLRAKISEVLCDD